MADLVDEVHPDSRAIEKTEEDAAVLLDYGAPNRSNADQ